MIDAVDAGAGADADADADAATVPVLPSKRADVEMIEGGVDSPLPTPAGRITRGRTYTDGAPRPKSKSKGKSKSKSRAPVGDVEGVKGRAFRLLGNDEDTL
jgi:hypothetical protein